VERNGRAKAGPYPIIRPAEAGAGRYRCPAYKLLDEILKHHKRVRGAGEGSVDMIMNKYHYSKKGRKTMQDFYTILSIVSLLLTIGGLLGGFYAFKSSMGRTASEVQEHVINALGSEITTLRLRLDDMKAENIHLQLIIETICAAFKSRGLTITIDGDMVSIHDTHCGSTTTTHIQEREEPPCLQSG
jgi:hypothetical protein